MKITARSSGGFTGRDTRVELDTACHADGPALEALLDRVGFFQARAPACAVGADLVRWDITADDGARRRTVTLTEDSAEYDEAAGADWQALLARLRTLA